MKKFKIFICCLICFIVAGLCTAESFAAFMLSVKMNGNINYYATEIGAKVWGTYQVNNSSSTNPEYLELSGSGTVSDYVYSESGDATSYGNISATLPDVTFTSTSHYIELFVFIKNTGDRYIIPNVEITSVNSNNLQYETSAMFFDVSSGHTDPLATKSGKTATNFVSAINTQIANGKVSEFSTNSSIDNNDTYCLNLKISLKSLGGSASDTSSYQVVIAFMADVQYTSNDILSVFQTQNQTTTEWTKFGYNATLNAMPTKVETNSLQTLENALVDADPNGNANVTFAQGQAEVDPYSTSAPYYKDIDLVNVDINTGEIIGKLSDLNYNFEWFGREITLPQGTVLASGRTLANAETFTVDVYTYYPSLHVRRWVVGDKQWQSISDKAFVGSVEVPQHYVATFESTLFSPVVDANNDVISYTGSSNAYGTVPRSYVYDLCPLTSGSVNYQQNNYGYTSGTTSTTNQANMLSWSSNLTKAWKAYHTANPTLKTAYNFASTAQGEGYTRYVYNILYLIKYADNNSQAKVGYGNTYTFSLYNASGVTVQNIDGTSITTGGVDNYSRYESQKGSGSIGVYNSSSKGTATYSANSRGENVLSETGFDNAGMNYGYNNLYRHNQDKTGLYAHQFLTYNTGTKRILLDGYVGSDKYTSVFCLGQCNPWGNVWKWVFGSAVASDGTNVWAYVNFDDYDYSATVQNPSTGATYNAGNYITSSSSADFETFKTPLFEDANYIKMSYNLPTSSNYYRYMGTSLNLEKNPLAMLVGLQTSNSSTASSSTGLSDYYYVSNSTDYIFGVLSGGYTGSTTTAGAFYFSVSNGVANTHTRVGFRLSLTS